MIFKAASEVEKSHISICFCAEIIKTDDMMANLPVPRSSSEVVKPSELFLDLMMPGTLAEAATFEA